MKQLNKPTTITLELTVKEARDLFAGLCLVTQESQDAMHKMKGDRPLLAAQHEENFQRRHKLQEELSNIILGAA